MEKREAKNNGLAVNFSKPFKVQPLLQQASHQLGNLRVTLQLASILWPRDLVLLSRSIRSEHEQLGGVLQIEASTKSVLVLKEDK